MKNLINALSEILFIIASAMVFTLLFILVVCLFISAFTNQNVINIFQSDTTLVFASFIFILITIFSLIYFYTNK